MGNSLELNFPVNVFAVVYFKKNSGLGILEIKKRRDSGL